jgi:glycolate oxidase FAD binding subunit
LAAKTEDPEQLQGAVLALAHEPLELDSVDMLWEEGAGSVLARWSGARPDVIEGRVRQLLNEQGFQPDAIGPELEGGWISDTGHNARVRVAALSTDIAKSIRISERIRSDLLGIPSLGLFEFHLLGRSSDGIVEAVKEIRESMAPYPGVVVDSTEEVRRAIDPWDTRDGPELELMRRIKAQFDPTNTCNPGLFIGGI